MTDFFQTIYSNSFVIYILNNLSQPCEEHVLASEALYNSPQYIQILNKVKVVVYILLTPQLHYQEIWTTVIILIHMNINL